MQIRGGDPQQKQARRTLSDADNLLSALNTAQHTLAKAAFDAQPTAQQIEVLRQGVLLSLNGIEILIRVARWLVKVRR